MKEGVGIKIEKDFLTIPDVRGNFLRLKYIKREEDGDTKQEARKSLSHLLNHLFYVAINY